MSTLEEPQTKKKTVTLLLVDVQKDFHPGGSLAIPTADEDADRIAELIETHADKIDRIVATLDTHQKLHIAHPSFWIHPVHGHHPEPFTTISAKDLQAGLWKPRPDLILPVQDARLDAMLFPDQASNLVKEDGTLDLDSYVQEYARRLEAGGRFQLCIWPEHCLIGTTGHGIVDRVQVALQQWTERTGCSVEWVLKGQSLLTEMYSALQADVVVNKETAFNQELQTSLQESDLLLVCGQAKSHCVNYTLRDIVDPWPKLERERLVLLTDCASAVPGFEEAADLFEKDMIQAGVRLRTSSQVETLLLTMQEGDDT